MPTPPLVGPNEYDGWSEEQLVAQVTRNVGAPGLGAHAELLRLLIVQLRESAKATDEQNRRLGTLTVWLLVLTVALFFLGIVQVVVAIRG